jgi:ACDE family multidrug resistance protein
VLSHGPSMVGIALATFAAGNVSAVIPSGYLSDRVGRRTLLIVGLSVSGVATAIVGWASSLPLFLAGAFVAGAAAGMFSSPQQAAVADIIGSKARAGTALAAFQMMADLGSIVGSFGVGEIAQHVSFDAAFVISGVILLVAGFAWVLAPETRRRPVIEPTPVRALGPEAGGELP